MLSIQLERPQKMAVNDIYATCNGCVCGAGSAGAKSTRQEQKIARALRHVTSISERIWRERKQFATKRNGQSQCAIRFLP